MAPVVGTVDPSHAAAYTVAPRPGSMVAVAVIPLAVSGRAIVTRVLRH